METPLRILHLEDDPDYCGLVKGMLEKEGWQVESVVVENRAGFISALEKAGFDIILADYSLPTYTGIDALKVARQRCPNIPFLLVSGTIGEQAAIESLKSGATDYVLKHWPERLVPAVRRAVQESRERAQRKQAETRLHLLNMALESAANAIMITDRTGAITWVNHAFSELTGYSFEEICGQKANLFRSGEHDPAFYQSLWETILSGGVWRGEMVNRRKDGSLCTVESTITPVLNDQTEITHFVAVKQDVTERKRAEAALCQSEEECRAMFEVASIGMAQADVRNGQWLRVNRKMCAITGYSAEELLQMHVRDITHPEDRKQDWELFQSVVRGEAPDYRLEKRYLRKDGVVTWVNVNMTVIRDAAGHPTRTMAVIEDITERKAAERRLRQLSRAVEQTASTVVITDILGNIEYANPRFEETTAYSLAEVLGKNVRILKSGSTPPAGYAELWQTITSGGTWRGEFHNKRKNGGLYWEYASISPITDEHGVVSNFVAVKEDITERKLAQETLRQSEERFRSLFELAPDGIYLCDFQGKFVDGNKAAEEIVGYARTELIGKSFLTLNLLSETDIQRAARALHRSVQGEATGPEEYVLIRKDGRSVPVEIRTFPVKIRDKALVLGIARDIADRKQLEAQFRQAQKMEGIGQLAGGVAHDFNNLLAVMRGNADLLLMDAEKNSAQTNECLTHIAAAAERAAALTRQLLIFSRKQTMQPQPLVLSELVSNLTKMLKRVIREDIHLECRCAKQLPFVQADAGMMEQMLLNLVVNARDAMPGGGQLLITTEGVTFGLPYAQTHPEARAGAFACLSVRDTGTGIAPEHLERIFEPFFTTKEPGKGTGLGLATVYGIVKQHQGWVEVTSRVGEGTTFKIFLPAIPPPANAAAAPTVVELSGGSETILLVEDDYSVRATMCRVLETFKYHVHEAANAMEALEVWRQHAGEIALLLTDMVMPEGVTGRDLAEQLRAKKPALKVIFMSGYSQEVVGKNTEFFRRTGSYFLHKPCAATTLIQMVRQCLDAKEPGRQES